MFSVLSNLPSGVIWVIVILIIGIIFSFVKKAIKFGIVLIVLAGIIFIIAKML